MNANNRRQFLQRLAALSGMGAVAPLGLSLSAMTQASAQSSGATDYRALVCIVLNGGNDSFNTVLATDQASWQHYTHHREKKDGYTFGIALPEPGKAANPSADPGDPARLGGVLPIDHQKRTIHSGRSFALHPALGKLQNLYSAGRVAVLANVGPLIQPTKKTDYLTPTFGKPAKLFSHNDQQSTWQSFEPEGAIVGWGGLMGDALMDRNGSGESAATIQRSFTCISPGGASVWLAGNAVQPYQSSTTSILGLGYGGTIYGHAGLHNAVAAIMGKPNSDGSGERLIKERNLLHRDHQNVAQRGFKASELLGSKLVIHGAAPWATPAGADDYKVFDDELLKYTSVIDGSRKTNPLALQLQMVARLIATNASGSLGITRQFFMVNLGGFDHHDNQIQEQAERLAQLDHAMFYFDTVLGSMPAGDMRSQVTTFTISEFGRTFTSNGDGTDHGWGGHHFIMGGAVSGTEIYGTFPTYSSADKDGNFSSPDQIENGSLIPSTSVDQYAYTLGRWMGVSDSDLSNILPHIGQFSVRDLGFMKG